MSACIIPVAPNFQDPPSATDSGPYFARFDPVDGRIVTYTAPGSTFSVIVTDQDVNATLYVRWVWDYPPANSTTTMILPSTQPEIKSGPDHQPINQPVSQTISCDLVNDANGLHQVELVVADTPFQDSSMVGLTDDNRFDTLNDPDNTGHIQRGTWAIVMSCMASTASTTSTQ